jgi:hypothetical protein
MPIIPILRRQRQEEHKFETSLGHRFNSRPAWVTSCLKKIKKKKKKERNEVLKY